MARSALKRHTSRIGDPDTDHLYNRAAGTRNDLLLRRCEAFVNEACDHGAIESMGKNEEFLRHAVRNARKQRQCLALLLAEAWFSWRRHHTRAWLAESLAADGRLNDTSYKRHLWRALIDRNTRFKKVVSG